VQAYLLHLLQERHRSRSTVNLTSCAVRFLVCDVLGQTERRVQIPLGRSPQRLPELLSRAEIAALFGSLTSIKARTFLMTAYASGLRLSELCHLRGCDIDSSPDRMCIRVVQGKGAKCFTEHLAPNVLAGFMLRCFLKPLATRGTRCF
jgi:site-specific recombinase XerD